MTNCEIGKAAITLIEKAQQEDDVKEFLKQFPDDVQEILLVALLLFQLFGTKSD